MIFFLLSFLILTSCLLLITSKNPVYSVLSLVFIFVNGSILLLLLGLDFLPFVFIIVYVGAVAVLFLFVVIILDIKIPKFEDNRQLLLIVFVFCYLAFNLLNNSNIGKNILNFFENQSVLYHESFGLHNEVLNEFDNFSNISLLGLFLYTEYDLHFVIGGLILLLAIIGAIVLTRKTGDKSKIQFDFKQFERSSFIGKNKNRGD